jgi:hypothetical protein
MQLQQRKHRARRATVDDLETAAESTNSNGEPASRSKAVQVATAALLIAIEAEIA